MGPLQWLPLLHMCVAWVVAYKPSGPGGSAGSNVQRLSQLRQGVLSDERAYWRRVTRTPPTPRVPRTREAIDDDELRSRLCDIHNQLALPFEKRQTQPLSRRLVGRSALSWLNEATTICAVEYVDFVSTLLAMRSTLPHLRDPATIVESANKFFGIEPLLIRVDELLMSDCPRPADCWPNGDLVRVHPPTVWASFSRSVAAQLRERWRSSKGLRRRWHACEEWKIMQRLAHGQARLGVNETHPTVQLTTSLPLHVAATNVSASR